MSRHRRGPTIRRPMSLPVVITIAWLVGVTATTPLPSSAALARAASLRSIPLSRVPRSSLLSPLTVPRGGSTPAVDHDEEEEEDEEEAEEHRRREEADKARQAVRKWRAEQQVLLNLRSTFLSEALAKRGLPVATISDVSTAEGDKPPEVVDWDCAMSTVEEPKTCLYSFDAEPNTRVIAPLGTTQWISLSALNRLRRTDPTKVEPMWHSRYAILKSWFSDSSRYSLLQHVGIRGFLVSNILLDLGGGVVLRSLLALGVLSSVIVLMPALEYLANRLLVSGALWARWYSWHRIVHAALPFKLLVGQMAWKLLATSFGKLEGRVRDYVVDLECSILEECAPLTVGPGSEVDEEVEGLGMEEGAGVDLSGEYDVEEEDDGDQFFDVNDFGDEVSEEDFYDAAEFEESESAF